MINNPGKYLLNRIKFGFGRSGKFFCFFNYFDIVTRNLLCWFKIYFDFIRYVSAWEWDDSEPLLHKKNLVFENVELKTRSYK